MRSYASVGSLQKNGYALVDDWNIDIGALTKQERARFAREIRARDTRELRTK